MRSLEEEERQSCRLQISLSLLLDTGTKINIMERRWLEAQKQAAPEFGLPPMAPQPLVPPVSVGGVGKGN